MAGRPKKGIDYAGWSVDIFSNDTKIDKLLDAQGWVGFGIYFYLCQMAFGGEGYFYEWCYDLCATTARKMGGGVGAGTVKETVDYCLHIGLFDKGLYDRWKVLTSRGIQKSYLVVLKSKKRRGTEIYNEYWLLDKNDDDYQGVVFVGKNDSKFGNNDDLLGINCDTFGGNDHSHGLKESKVKCNKNICASDDDTMVVDGQEEMSNKSKEISPDEICFENFEKIYAIYPLKKGKQDAFKHYKAWGTGKKKNDCSIKKLSNKEMYLATRRYVDEMTHIDKLDYLKHFSTFMNNGIIDYLEDRQDE